MSKDFSKRSQLELLIESLDWTPSHSRADLSGAYFCCSSNQIMKLRNEKRAAGLANLTFPKVPWQTQYQ